MSIPEPLPAAPAARTSPDAAFAAFDRLATLIAVVGEDARIRFANTALENAWGLSRLNLHGLALDRCMADPAAFVQAIRDAGSGAFSALRYDTQLLRPGQEALPVHVVIAQGEQPDQVVIEMLPLDTQARHEREDRLLAEAQAHKELVRNLAHEIKNPLGGLRGAAQLLEMELEDPALKEYTQVIVREADRLQALVDRMLAPHRSAPKQEWVNIHEICEHVQRLVLAEFPSGLTVVRDYDASIPEFQGDRERLIQAVLNIVRNAAQALVPQMREGRACITLRTRVARQITLGRQRHKLALELLVIDNGPGIAPVLLEQVFYPLVTGKADGTGLGLTLAQSFVQQHQGLIECESAPGHTVFRVTIPLG